MRQPLTDQLPVGLSNRQAPVEDPKQALLRVCSFYPWLECSSLLSYRSGLSSLHVSLHFLNV